MKKLLLLLSVVVAAPIASAQEPIRIGEISSYPFEIVSVVLLVVMIGAAYLAKGRRKD